MLEKLRAKPDHVKKSISLALTIFIFSGIVFVWLSSWDARNTGGETREKTLSPLAGFTTIFQGVISDVQSAISGSPSYVENRRDTGVVTPTSTGITVFDMSGVVVIDPSRTASTTGSTTTSF